MLGTNMHKNILLGIILFFSALQFCGEKEVSGTGKSVSFKNQNAVFANPDLVNKINNFLSNNDERAFAATCTEQYHRYCLEYRIERALNLPPQILPKQFAHKGWFDATNYLKFGIHLNGNFVVNSPVFCNNLPWGNRRPNLFSFDVLRTITPNGEFVSEIKEPIKIDFLYCLSSGAVFLQKKLLTRIELIDSAGETLWKKDENLYVQYACEHIDRINKANTSLFYLANEYHKLLHSHNNSIVGGSIFQVNAQTGEKLRSFNTQGPCNQLFLILNNFLVYSNLEGLLSLWDLNCKSVEPSFTSRETNIRALAKLDEETFVSGDKGGLITIWQIENLKTGLACVKVRDIVVASPNKRAIQLVPFPNQDLYFILCNWDMYHINMNVENPKLTLVSQGPKNVHALPDGRILVRYDGDQDCKFCLTPYFLQQKLAECEGKSPEEQRKILAPYPRLYETLFPQRPETMDEWRVKQKPFINLYLAFMALEARASRFGKSSKNNPANAEQSGSGGAGGASK